MSYCLTVYYRVSDEYNHFLPFQLVLLSYFPFHDAFTRFLANYRFLTQKEFLNISSEIYETFNSAEIKKGCTITVDRTNFYFPCYGSICDVKKNNLFFLLL